MKRFAKLIIIVFIVVIFNPVSFLLLYGFINNLVLQYPSPHSPRIKYIQELYDILEGYSFKSLSFDDSTTSIPFEHNESQLIVSVDSHDYKKFTKYVENAFSANNGIIFVVQYTIDGDVKGYYCSHNPDKGYLRIKDAVPITDKIYYVCLSIEEVISFEAKKYNSIILRSEINVGYNT